MSAQIPSQEPTSLTAGETWAWTKTLSDFTSTDGWTLKYVLQAAGATLINITASPSGTGFSVNVTAATTAGYAPGNYMLIGYVEGGSSERHRVFIGALTVLPSLLAGGPSTPASRSLALLQAAIEGRIPNGLEETNIDGQAISRTPFKILCEMRDRYQAIVNAEQKALAALMGVPVRNTIGIRFVRAR